jgi:predicted nucleic acid-binding protein
MSARTPTSSAPVKGIALYLIDTNVISEARKGARADVGVRQFVAEVDPSSLFLAVQTVGELRCGMHRLRARGDIDQALRLETWLSDVLQEFDGRILAFDRDCADVWGVLMAKGSQNPIDKQIAAVAAVYDLTLVTRDVADMAMTGVQLLNPFAAGPAG